MSTPLRTLFDLSGKTALVTGGSRGLGLQIAEALGEAGARVMLTSRKAGDLEESAAQLRSQGIEALWIAADASQPSEIVRVSEDAIARLGHIDILVNNAGATWGAAAEDHPLEAWDKVMNLNIRSVFLMSQAIGKHSMIPRRQGKIINVASIAGLAGNSAELSMLAYNTSKAAVVNFTRTLAGEWGKFNINVNALAPGMFPSRMTRGTIDRIGAESLAGHAPLLRIGDDDDLKGATLLFASQAGKHITGQILPIDGGVSAIIAA
jgi:NAD(P)-dependent dehydrogenase (short-subunit alcohol dehydrogenase family)